MQIIIPAGVNILTHLRGKGLFVPAHCSGAGVCGKCVVRLVAGSLDITPDDKALLSERQLDEGFRLACKAITKAPVRIELPDNDTDYRTADEHSEEFDKSHTFGIAADIGTTTVAVSLVDITARRAVRTVTATNSGIAYGADVITRLGVALAGGSAQIKKAMQSDLSSAISSLGCDGLEIKAAAIAANTAMYHLLLGLDCTGLTRAPFAPATLGGEVMTLGELLGETPFADVSVTLIRGISAFVGGDITSGLAAADCKAGTLFLDLGTNGEAALVTDEGVLCASAAAGPALEGGELSCGVGGVRGAICRVYVSEGTMRFDTIDNAPPVGICGSGAIDALAYCVRHKLVDDKGVFLDSLFDNGLHLADNISLTQQDIREMQLAKAAIRATLDTLISTAGRTYADIDRLMIAGGFGHFTDINSACAIGLIPPELKGRAVTPGNTSLKGAQLSLYDEGFAKRIENLTQNAATLPLSEDEGFKKRFIENISF